MIAWFAAKSRRTDGMQKGCGPAAPFRKFCEGLLGLATGGAGAVALIMLVVHETRFPEPILDLRILSIAQFDLLPMAFGTVAQSADALSRLLEEYRDALTAQLQRVAGAVEMGLRLNLDVTDPIAYLVERTPELRAARDRLFHRHKQPSHDERIRLGQLCDEALRRYRETQTTQMMALLGPSCVGIAALAVREENEVSSLAVLVQRDAIDRFETAVNVAAAQLADELAVTISGPWPPYNFVRLNLHESLGEYHAADR